MAAPQTLVVDASGDGQETTRVLEERGCLVRQTDSIAETTKQLRSQRIDAVITEYQLPDGDGIELLEEIRATHEYLPVVIYTAHGDEAVASRAINANVSAYIPKGRSNAGELLVEKVTSLAVPDSSEDTRLHTDGPPLSVLIRAIDESPVGITLSDPSLPDNPVMYANDAFKQLTGYDTEFVTGKNCRFLQGPETSEKPVSEMARAIEQEEPVSVELLNYRQDGTPFWNNVTIAPIFDSDGELTHYVGFQQDITERKEAEMTAQQRANALREERQALERVVGRVTGLVSNIAQLLVWANDREDIVEQVCTEIANTDGYCNAWIAEQTAAGDELSLRLAAGSQENVQLAEFDWQGTIVDQVLQNGTVSVSNTGESMPAPLAAEQFGGSIAAAIPLLYRRRIYGVLCVYAKTDSVLDRREVTMLEALGQMVASGINAVETKEVLTADRVTELGVEITDESFPLVELAAATDGEISYTDSTFDEDGMMRMFVTMAAGRDEFDALLDECESIVDGFVVARQNGRLTAAVEVTETHAFEELSEYGATLRDISVANDGQTARIDIELPTEGDPRSVIAVLESAYDNTDMVRHHERQREPRPKAEFETTVAERLTNRQYTALETAYHSEYFEFPRPVSGEELAESMDISRQTYHQHLRTALRKLLDEYFDYQE